jgi:hypothetical protein
MRLHNINYSSKLQQSLYKSKASSFLTLYFTFTFIILNYHSFAQKSDTIFKNYKKIESQKIDSIANFNKQKDNYKYLAILPSINYNVIDNSFGVGVNLSNFSNYYQTKKRNEIEAEKLKFQLLDAQNKALENLSNEYELILNTFEILRLELDNTTLAKEIFNLKKSQYENNKITLEMWLNVQNDFQKMNLLLFAKRKNLITKMKQFEVKIKSPCFRQELEYLSIKITN